MGNYWFGFRNGTCHGVALWMDFHLDLDTVVSTGPQEEVIPGTRVVWDQHTRQGVYFLLPEEPVISGCALRYKAVFSPTTGDIVFNFSIDT